MQTEWRATEISADRVSHCVNFVQGQKRGYVVLDQIRAVDRRKLIRHLGRPDPETPDKVLGILREMFANQSKRRSAGV